MADVRAEDFEDQQALRPSSTAAIILGTAERPDGKGPHFPTQRLPVAGFASYLVSSAGLSLDPDRVLNLFDAHSTANNQIEKIETFLRSISHAGMLRDNIVTDLLLYYRGFVFDGNGEVALSISARKGPLHREAHLRVDSIARALSVAVPQLRLFMIFDFTPAFDSKEGSFSIRSGTINMTSRAQIEQAFSFRRDFLFYFVYDKNGTPSTHGNYSDDSYLDENSFTRDILKVLRDGVQSRRPYFTFAELNNAVYYQILNTTGKELTRVPVLHSSWRERALSDLLAFPNPAYVADARHESAQDTSAPRIKPTIPPQRPAALEPIWEDGRLILAGTPAPSDGDPSNALAALHAIRAEFTDLVEDAEGVNNIDSRAIAYFRRLVERIPKEAPTNFGLHRIAVNESTLFSYGKTVSEEWPTLLATRYHALTLQFERAMRQFPAWREFKRNADMDKLSKEQAKSLPKLAAALGEGLRTEQLKEIISQEILERLDDLATQLVNQQEAAGGSPIEVDNELLEIDALESINNVVKRIAEPVLATYEWTSETFKEGGQEYAKHARKSIVEEFGKVGDKTGPALFKFMKWATVGGVTTGTTYAFSHLVALYPSMFAWLNPLGRLLH